MDNLKFLEQFHDEMSSPNCDARAEAILALAMEQGMSYEDLVIFCDSFFYREYSKDIFYTQLQEDGGKSHLLECHLSRSGLFDQLPEGLFFRPIQSDKHISNAGEMAAEYKINKQKERRIRLFFQPI